MKTKKLRPVYVHVIPVYIDKRKGKEPAVYVFASKDINHIFQFPTKLRLPRKCLKKVRKSILDKLPTRKGLDYALENTFISDYDSVIGVHFFYVAYYNAALPQDDENCILHKIDVRSALKNPEKWNPADYCSLQDIVLKIIPIPSES